MVDAFISPAKNTRIITERTSKWMLIGLGNCMVDKIDSIPHFYQNAISEELCRRTADNDEGAMEFVVYVHYHLKVIHPKDLVIKMV